MTHVCMYVHIHTHTSIEYCPQRPPSHEACMYVCMHACMYVCMYVCAHTYTHKHGILTTKTSISWRMHACMHVCMYLCMYLCMYVCALHFTMTSDAFLDSYLYSGVIHTHTSIQYCPQRPPSHDACMYVCVCTYIHTQAYNTDHRGLHLMAFGIIFALQGRQICVGPGKSLPTRLSFCLKLV